MPGRILHELHALWLKRRRQDEYVGTLVNAWLAEGGQAQGVKAGSSYVDVGTLHGYRAAIRLLAETAAAVQPAITAPERRAHPRQSRARSVGAQAQMLEQ
jgi:hypothetical protein